MKYQLKVTTLKETIKELNDIRTNKHKDFKGDGIYNVEFVLSTFTRKNPEEALKLSEKLQSVYDNNDTDMAGYVHILRIKQYAYTIKNTLRFM